MTKRSLKEWDIFQLKLARQYSTMSKDPSTKVGAVVTDDGSKYVYGLGYNGFSPAANDDYAYTLGRDYKIKHTIHAEINAMNQMEGHPHNDFTLVAYPFIPCSKCAEEIIDRGQIRRVVTLDYTPERWKSDFLESERILTEAGITITKYLPSDLGDSDAYRP
jgi:dCMP deaminase